MALSPRQFGNVVYARLAAACLDGDARKQLDEDLYAPLGGWEAAEQRLWAAIMAPGPGAVT